MDKYPKRCNICGGPVIYTTNDKIYGKKYGSGFCYLCTQCGAYVGTHKPRPKEALGLLADERMRKGKIVCHSIFDSMWKGKPKAQKKRQDLYIWLANRMGIPVSLCHFGYFTLNQLIQAHKILSDVSGKKMTYTSSGELVFTEAKSLESNS